MKSGIYAWKLDGVYKYVGYGTDVEKRMLDRHQNNPYIPKYDYSLFEKVIIRICKPNELQKLEIYYIKKLHTHISEGGFNCNWGGGGSFELSSETKEKMSSSHLGKCLSEETKKKMSENHSDFSGKNNPNFGKQASEEIRKKMSDAQSGENHWAFGKDVSAETRKKIAISHIGEKRKNASSKYYGVTMNKSNPAKNIYWMSSIRENGKTIYIGNFKTQIEAAKAYDQYIIEHNLDRPLNFPK